MLPVAVVCVTLALLIYTVAVGLPFFRRRLSFRVAAALWAGFFFDTLGTVLMSVLAGGWKPTFHGYAGVAGNSLMLLVAVGATVLVRRGNVGRHHWYWPASVGVWALWLVPMIGGAVFGGRV